MRKKNVIIEPGHVYNNLTVITYSHSDERSRKWYNVICDCGVSKKIMGSAMVSGNTKSCGCYSSMFKKEHQLLPDNLGVKRQIILQYKRHAKSRSIDYNINENDFILLLGKNCYYCGLPPSNIKNTKNYKGFKYSGVDRIRNSEGYLKGNCVPCCEQCNRAKRDLTINEFKTWITRISKAMAEQWSKMQPIIK